MLDEVAGGYEALKQNLETHRDELSRFKAGRFAERREEVRRALEHAGCAVTLTTKGVADTSEAGFLMRLLSPLEHERRDAYRTLVLQPPANGEARTQTYLAVFALIEADLRSDFIRIFLRLQPRWPAAFVRRLRDLAANGTQGDRVYVVELIKQSNKVNNPQVRQAFHLEGDGRADLQAILDSNGARLWGHGFRGAARSD